MKILHTGDLHLDSPFCAAGALGADERRQKQRESLSRVFACAKEEECDLILIAGDLFDGKIVTPETAALVLRLFRESTCPVVIAPGNHDPYTAGSFWSTATLPKQVYLFRAKELSFVEPEGLNARIWGYAFTSAALGEDPLVGAIPPEKDGKWDLLCAHCDLLAPLSRHAPVTVGSIERLGVDYAALGHVHNPAPVAEGETIRYCGFVEGRSFDELGEGGVWIVTLEEGKSPVIRRRVLSECRYELDEVDLSDCAEEGEMEQAIGRVIDRYDATTHLRLSLTGTVESLPDLRPWTEKLGQGLASLELRDETIPAHDDSVLQKDVGLRGAFYRSLYPKLIDEDGATRQRAILALQIGLAAIDGRQIPERRDEI